MIMTGGCLCGSFRYEVEGKQSAVVGNCYCLDCQRETGSGHLTFVSIPAYTIRVSGAFKDYVRQGDSGADVTRRFCPECGTTIIGYSTVQGEIGAIRAGTLDDSSGIAATFAEYSTSARSWDIPPSDLKVFQRDAGECGYLDKVDGVMDA